MNIYDIAKKAGLSIATVSRAMNNKGNVSEATKKKVASVIAQMNYIPNAMARGLATSYSKTVAVLVPDAESHFSIAIATLEKLLEQYDYDVMLYCTGKDRDEMEKYFNRALYKKSDAIILVGSLFEKGAFSTENMSLPPIISINSSFVEDCYAVMCDEKQAVKELVLQAYAEGKNKPAFVYDVDTFSSSNKCEGFLQAIKQLGLPEGEYAVIKRERYSKRESPCINDLLDGYNLVVCTDDVLAASVLNSLVKAGSKVPNEVAVVGFNNTYLCEVTSPTLSSIDNKLRDACKVAVDILHDVFNGVEREHHTSISMSLVRRESY